MKRHLLLTATIAAVGLAFSGCAALEDIVGKKEFQLTKSAGTEYFISVQSVKKYSKPCASSKVLGTLKLGDKIVAAEIVAFSDHLATDKADSWIGVTAGKEKFYIPGNVIVTKTLWEEQLNGLPPRGGVKVKNFSSSKHQDADADLNVADTLSPKELFYILGAAGAVKSEGGKAFPVELGKYIQTQHKGAKAPMIRLPQSQRSPISLPSASAFLEIGPYQEFDMGSGLAVYMIDKALKPDHPVTQYVAAIVNRLAAKSTMPMPYGGYNVVVLKDDKTVNACAAPGGFVFVTTGMLKYLKSETELALILAHEIGHLEFHHSVRELGVADYGSFAVAAIVADINLKDPRIAQAIIALATENINKIPFADKLDPATRKAKIEEAVQTITAGLQKAIDESLVVVNKLLQIIGENTKKGHNTDFEAAADRRAVSLATAAGYDPASLIDVLARIKKDNNGFGDAYPANRDELAKKFSATYKVKTQAKPVGNYALMLKRVKALKKTDLFIR